MRRQMLRFCLLIASKAGLNPRCRHCYRLFGAYLDPDFLLWRLETPLRLCGDWSWYEIEAVIVKCPAKGFGAGEMITPRFDVTAD